MENICSLAFNCFIIMTIITNEDLPELRANRGFYSLGSTCHHNKPSLEISPVLYFKGLHIRESYLCILSGWLLLYKTVSISQDEVCRAEGRTKANVGSPSHTAARSTLLEGGWDPPGARGMGLPVLQVFVHLPSTGEPPPGTLLPSHIPSQQGSLCKAVRVRDVPVSAEMLHAEKTKSPAILISIVKTKPLKKKQNQKILHNNALKKTGLVLNCAWLA